MTAGGCALAAAKLWRARHSKSDQGKPKLWRARHSKSDQGKVAAPIQRGTLSTKAVASKAYSRSDQGKVTAPIQRGTVSAKAEASKAFQDLQRAAHLWPQLPWARQQLFQDKRTAVIRVSRDALLQASSRQGSRRSRVAGRRLCTNCFPANTSAIAGAHQGTAADPPEIQEGSDYVQPRHMLQQLIRVRQQMLKGGASIPSSFLPSSFLPKYDGDSVQSRRPTASLIEARTRTRVGGGCLIIDL
eukprot:1156601-Pelagomonas_calceolata.AAC.6